MKMARKDFARMVLVSLISALLIYVSRNMFYKNWFSAEYTLGSPKPVPWRVEMNNTERNEAAKAKVNGDQDDTNVIPNPNTKPDTDLRTTNDKYEQNQRQYDILATSKTKPKFYPLNGTGTTVDIRNKYDFGVFNSFCRVDWTISAILPVYSAPGNFNQRRAIRETVGKECNDLKCRIFFIIGISFNDSLNDEVKKEYYKEKDILMVDKIDTYRDLNNKVVAMLDWLMKYCTTPKYVIHLIDDTYPNLPYLLNHLMSMKTNRFIIGLVWHRSHIIRDQNHKWYVSTEEFPYAYYPDYIAGPVYAFLNSDSGLLRNNIHASEYLWIEDVWFTGMVAKKAQFSLIPFKNKFYDQVPNIAQGTWHSYASVHNVNPEQYYNIFSIVST